MAVYTHLGAEDLADLIAHYDVGELISAKGIAEGVSNSNWLIETTGTSGTNTRFILTMYERRIELSDLPFFLDLMDHLAAKGCPVPRTIHDREGASFRYLDGKAIALIEYLPGVSVDHPTAGQARSVGRALGQNHLAVKDFGQTRANDMGLAAWSEITARCGDAALAEIDPALPSILKVQLEALEKAWPGDLPGGVVHCDLFPDNVLMLGEHVSGLIDFYFSATDAFAYDLAVTHAAWSFSGDGSEYRQAVADALMEGYESVRPLSDQERECLPVLARGAAIRFVTSRAEDWISTPADALVTRKDPMDFARRLEFYDKNGASLFEGVR
ncbi:homoserine kinase [Erythrobacter sp. KY5]|uniref:homoserine kinase n=1 Tax=Erythrobacter sp. KY5 TaxID=2011159 RepID=UPI000DBF0F5B|nr:homoserine kinase [Erythrobacter sp. KY5]AWW73948.1 homoserine kinase [Erythrobacter sp. KY5]